MDTRRALAIAVGAMVGSSLRWGLTRLLGADGLDVALLSVNVVGCLVLGFVAQYPQSRFSRDHRALVGAGLCGSLTTWSSLAIETASDLRGGAYLDASSWLVLNLVVGLSAAVVGRALGRRRGPRHPGPRPAGAGR